jgi:hypothetical protein
MTVRERCDAIEECYEFMLGYAARGVPGDGSVPDGGQLRDLLARAEQALDGLGDAFGTAVAAAGLEPAARYRSFLTVLDRDARSSRAAVRLVLVQPTISSQLVDNLNASIHLRALLMDLFLIDELLTARASGAAQSEHETGSPA